MSPEKLAQLRRQRELVQQHLDWLDGEIANHSAQEATDTKGDTPTAPALVPVDPAREELAMPTMKPDPLSSSAEAKRGCLILFFIIVGLLAATLIGIYFWKYRDRPLLFPEKAAAAYSSRRVSV